MKENLKKMEDFKTNYYTNKYKINYQRKLKLKRRAIFIF